MLKKQFRITPVFYLLIIFTVIYNGKVLGQNVKLDWAGQIGGSGQEDSYAIAVDDNGSMYSTGWFDSEVDFDPGAETHSLQSYHGFDAYFSKLTSEGMFGWAHRISSTASFAFSANDRARDVVVSDSGYIYATGNFYGTVDFEPGPGTTTLTSAGEADIFIVKYTSSGNLVWAKRIGAAQGDYGYGIAVDANGNVYTTGQFSWPVDFDPGPGTYTLTPVGHYDAFVCKLDASGNFVWARNMGGTNGDIGYTIAVDKEGNVYSGGIFRETADFNPGAGTFNLTAATNACAYISKLNSDGNFEWAWQIKQKELFATSAVNSLVTDQSGNIYATGYFSDTSDFNPFHGSHMVNFSKLDLFLVKLSVGGDLTWINHSKSPNSYGYDLAIDKYANLYMIGSLGSAATLGDISLNAYSFIAKIDSSGAYNWATNIGNYFTRGNAIAVDKSGGIYVTGRFSNSADFDPGESTFELTAVGAYDSFVQKLIQCESSSSNLKMTVCDSVVSPSGNYTWTESGTYTDTITNTLGCDSIVTIELLFSQDSYGDDLIINACDSFVSPSGKFTWLQSGTYTDTIPNALGCDSIITVNLTMETIDTSITQNLNSLTSNQDEATYQWLDCNLSNASIPGKTGKSLSVNESGIYAVEITKNGCKDTSMCYAMVFSKLHAPDQFYGIKVYPSPTNENVTLQLNKDDGYTSYSISNELGQIIETNELKNTDKHLIKLPESRGIYILKVTIAEGATTTIPIIKY